MRYLLLVVIFCSTSFATPTAKAKLPDHIEEITWLKLQLAAARIANFEQQKTLAEMAVRQAAAELAQETKSREAMVFAVRAEYKIGNKDQVDDKGVITRAASVEKSVTKK